jgi:hypothetical protein
LTDEGWVEAGSLTLGDQILSLDGTFGDVESISISNDPQLMYNLTVDISHTFAVGEGQWVVHNCNAPPVDVSDGWENRFRGNNSESNAGQATGLYEYRSWGEETGSVYVGITSQQSITGRLRTKSGSFGNDWGNVIYSPIEFRDIDGYTANQVAEIAERIRLEQIWSQTGNMSLTVQRSSKRLIQTASRSDVIQFMQSGLWTQVTGWPRWLQLPDNLINLPKGWR